VREQIEGYLERLRVAIDTLPRDDIVQLGELLYGAYRDGKHVFVLGNGGSASTASHMAADLAKNTIEQNMRRFRILSLNDNTALLTALANDLGYENVFAEQLKNLIRAGDVLVAISGGGEFSERPCSDPLRAGAISRGRCHRRLRWRTRGEPRRSLDSGRLRSVRDRRGRSPRDQPHPGRLLQAAPLRRQTVGSVTRAAAFLDRDGTLNVRPSEHEYLANASEFVWLPGAREALARLHRAGYVLAVVSNQRGVARGSIAASALDEIEARIQHDLAGYGCRVEAFRYCLHDVDAGCECRKPRPGMLLELAHELDLDLARSWMIGDAESDVMAGQAAGCRTAFLGTLQAAVAADVVAASLDEASRVISGASVTTAR
jgi:D-glycero-D-manno-heptose 1,7-bisphosphate phosphatase